MDIKSRAELLKKFIEICDTEIFPKKQLAIYVVNKSFVSGDETASYNNTDYLRMILFTPLILLNVILARIIFLAKRDLNSRENLILRLYALKSIKIGFHRESYFVKKQKHLLDMDLVRIASIAYHEVRHRVQYNLLHQDGGKYDENEELLRIYAAGRVKALNSLNPKKVKKNNVEFECDAYFIQNILTKRLKHAFPTGSFSIAEFRIFIRENKDSLIWRNPYLK